MSRETPISKEITAWYGAGRWFHRRGDAYYAIAKQLAAKRYPRWLDQCDLEQPCGIAEGGTEGNSIGDVMAECDGVKNWRRAQDRRRDLFFSRASADGYELDEYFDGDKWKRFVRRVARYLAFVDSRRR